jgi:hypothetical protein
MMDFLVKPVIGEWFETASGESFEVVAIDREDGSVEIQYFDGAIEELDFSVWQQMQIQPADAPEDWSGPLDMMREDYLSDTGMSSHEDYLNPLDTLDSIDMDAMEMMDY